jgi:hypothetical protein
LSITLEPEEVDFTIEKEGWNIYELGDGSVLRVRPIVVKIFKLKARAPQKGAGYGIAGQTAMVAKARPDRKGTPPSQPYPPEMIEKAQKTKITCTEKEEIWNTYLVPDNRRVKVKVVVTSVARAEGLYDQFGNPIYVIGSDNIISSEPVA